MFVHQNAWTYATFFGHWMPLFLTYSYLESFSNRFASLVWLVPLFFCICFSWAGAAVNFTRCHINSGLMTLQCSQFAFFIGLGRLILAGGWMISILVTYGSRRGQGWLVWKLLSCLVSAMLYLVCMFLDGTSWEVLWFLAIGVDLVLLAVPNSFVWMDDQWTRLLFYLFIY